MRHFITLLIIFCLIACNASKNNLGKKELAEKITNQLKYSPVLKKQNLTSSKRIFPRSLESNGDIRLVGKRDWTSGFYPGVLWFTYELTNQEEWKNYAVKFTELLESEKHNASNHDIGFKMMGSYGLGYKYTKNKAYKDVLVESAKTLITRFNENVGCIRSWDHNKDKWDFPVIIDNLMNLELLYWAWKETGDSVFYNIATTHAKTTMKNHFRNDYSSYHVVGYNPNTGEVVSKNTHQGYADESSWARGQAWALYGYTMIYRETKEVEFLNQAEHVANYIMNIANWPKDYVPVWDFDLKDDANEPRDASAAAVIASALYELSTFTKSNNKPYLDMADKIMNSLSSNKYFSTVGTNKGFLLKHSTGSKPKEDEVDVPLIYADYYYLEALLRKQKSNN
ncbi:glycoside hydrolase family 88 protein [Seonamhaeicola sp. NFXS20]|uniref:glucuronyl hydrolase n=1 Tax=unclassified Seonamhaeicola TaxID=2622645 RepID=UPI003567F81D